MPVLLALSAALLFGLVFGPQWWVRRAMQQHATERPDLPGTGGELARNLLDLARLEHVLVEIAPADHYDRPDLLRLERRFGIDETAKVLRSAGGVAG